jgi:hypothetical protein
MVGESSRRLEKGQQVVGAAWRCEWTDNSASFRSAKSFGEQRARHKRRYEPARSLFRHWPFIQCAVSSLHANRAEARRSRRVSIRHDKHRRLCPRPKQDALSFDFLRIATKPFDDDTRIARRAFDGSGGVRLQDRKAKVLFITHRIVHFQQVWLGDGLDR